MKKRLILLLVGVVFLTACSGGKNGEAGDRIADDYRNWELGEELAEHLEEKLYTHHKVQGDLYIEGSDQGKSPRIITYNEGIQGVVIQLDQELIYNSSRVYATYALPNIKEEDTRELYESIDNGQELLAAHLEKEEFVQGELMDKEQVQGYSGLFAQIKGKEYLTLLPEHKELTDYKVLFREAKFQQKLLDSGLNLDNLKIYSLSQLGLLDISGLLFTDGITEYVYTREINYLRSGPWISALQLDSKEITLEEGFYPAKAVMDLSVDEMDFLRQQGVYIDGKDDAYYRELLNVPLEPDPTEDEKTVLEELDPEEAETEDTEETEESPSVDLPPDISVPDESMAGGTPLTNPGIPEGEGEGSLETEVEQE